MDSMLLQKQIRDNAEDLRSYMNDLKNWESEMKRKESEIQSTECVSQDHPPVRSKVKKVSKGRSESKSKNGQSEPEHKKGEGDSRSQTGKSTEISGFDYASWDKFDVDKACEELDSEQQSSENEEELVTDVEKERKREEALYEKERGNDFVKSGKWKEAIQCYNRAIRCYPHDAIFYANRALCYLRIQELKSAEADCTTALQLDSNYVKAYQRRAMARAGLGQFAEARVDLQRALEIEPKNTASKAELSKIEKKLNLKTEQIAPKPSQELKIHRTSSDSIVKQSVTNEAREEEPKKNKPQKSSKYIEAPGTSSTANTNNEMELEKQAKYTVNNEILEKQSAKLTLNDNVIAEEKLWPDEENVKLVQPTQKPPHLRSKKPMKRISIKDVDNTPVIQNTVIQDLPSFEDTVPEAEHSKTEDKLGKSQSTVENRKEDGIKRDTTAVKKTFTSEQSSEKLNEVIEPVTTNLKSDAVITDQIPPAPSTSVQFYVNWKKARTNPELSYLYLKQIPGSEIPKLFRDSLESNTFSDIITTIEKTFLPNKEIVLPYIVGLTKVRRFSALVMFLTESDKAGIKKILQYCREQGECSEDYFRDLKKEYELL